VSSFRIHIPKDADNTSSIEKARNAHGLALSGRRFTWLIIAAILIASLGIAAGIAKFGLLPGLAVLMLVIAIPVLYILLTYQKAGIVVLLTAAYFIMLTINFANVDFPLGTTMDALVAILILAFLLRQKFQRNWQMLRNPISIMIVIWITYNLLEVLNPDAASRMSWIYTVRSVALFMLTYFLFMFNIRTVAFIKFLLKMWLAYCLFAALWSFKQEYIGLAGFEFRSLTSNPMNIDLFFIDGRWRKFSIFPDPVTFSYNMVAGALLCIGLMMGPISSKKKWILGILTFIFLWAMLFSGTRGAYVLVPAGVFMLIVLNFNRNMLLLAIAGAIGFVTLIFLPTENKLIKRFQTAFAPAKDPSFNVRASNQKKIQPYILSHPMGGGLGATGVWGQRFAPQSLLAKFPPDSGYVRVAVELGWIGLLLFCTFMFIVLRSGIVNYYAIKDPMLKSICLAMLLVAFAINIGNYPQEALVQFPMNIYFYLVAALINITRQLDDAQNAASTNHISAHAAE
jgi:hypothetical protein